MPAAAVPAPLPAAAGVAAAAGSGPGVSSPSCVVHEGPPGKGAVGAVGSRVEDFVEAFRPYVEAGYDEVYVSQIGPEQDGWFDFWERELRPALAEL